MTTPAEKVAEIRARVIADLEIDWHLREDRATLLTLLDEAYQRAITDAIMAVRFSCSACDGSGEAKDAYNDPHECEYCGRPIAAIRAIIPLPVEGETT